MNFEIHQFQSLSQCPAELSLQLEAVFPNDALRLKRLRNLGLAHYILVAKSGHKAAGILFVRRVLGLPNTTWIVSADFRRQGIAFLLLERAKADHAFLTAVCRNEPSAALAKKAHFRIFPLGIATWVRPK